MVAESPPRHDRNPAFETTMSEEHISITNLLDRIVLSHKGLVKCVYTNNRAVMWPGLHGIRLNPDSQEARNTKTDTSAKDTDEEP